MKQKQLPKTVYVKREGEPGDDYLAAGETPDDLAQWGETVTAGMYQLVKTVKVRVKVETE